MTRFVVILLSVAIALIAAGWSGLRVPPKPFAPFPGRALSKGAVPFPDGLPAPVERFYREIYGDSIPVIESAVISGRASLRIRGVTFPGRFRFTHIAGKGYRHYIEATLFGLPVMKVDERYVDGKARMELPFGVIENEPKVDQAANLALWGEAMWFPSLYVNDPMARWEPFDDVAAILVVPFGDTEERFVVRFDPGSGLPRLMEAMRYKSADSGEKTLWMNELLEWSALNGYRIFTVGAVTWLGEGRPWAIFRVEEIVYNVDVKEYIKTKGP